MDTTFAAARPITSEALGLGGQRELAQLGRLPRAPRLAIVGSRAARRDRIDAVDTVVEVAARHGLTVVSGGALGIDAAAHRAALRHGVRQVAVLPCGPDVPYPPGNIPLFRDILAAHSALLFGRPSGRMPSRGAFVSRNALVVGLATRVFIAQVAANSGTMNTARLALKTGLPVAVLAGQPVTAELKRRGATVLAFPTSPQTLAADLTQWLAGRTPPQVAWPAEFAVLHAALASAGPAGLSVDAVPPSLLVLLIEAEAAGLVGQRCPGRYVVLR